MKVNAGFYINKLIKVLHRPALRDCEIDSTSQVGSASNCIRVKIGRYSYMGSYNSVTDTEIGAFCSIASYCAIGGGRHRLGSVSTSPVFTSGHNILKTNFSNVSDDENQTVYIGNDVWIGEGVFIKDGISIGTGAVIGAHSVVTKDIPPYAIAAGSPAKVIRFRFEDQICNRLLESKWWDWPEEKLKSIDFQSIDSFLKSCENPD